jgi:hypothetical protein
VLGGEGHELTAGDFWSFLIGTNAETQAEDKWNSIAGIDFRLRLPKLHDLQVYGELYGEDQATALGFIPAPSKNAGILGIYVPKLTPDGDWDLTLEYGHTSNWWYTHWVYTDGYTYKGDIIGDAMGYHGTRYFARLTHYTTKGNYSLNTEHVTQDLDAAYPQEITSVWITSHNKLKDNLFLDGSFGVANIENKDYVSGRESRNYLSSLKLTKRY